MNDSKRVAAPSNCVVISSWRRRTSSSALDASAAARARASRRLVDVAKRLRDGLRASPRVSIRLGDARGERLYARRRHLGATQGDDVRALRLHRARLVDENSKLHRTVQQKRPRVVALDAKRSQRAPFTRRPVSASASVVVVVDVDVETETDAHLHSRPPARASQPTRRRPNRELAPRLRARRHDSTRLHRVHARRVSRRHDSASDLDASPIALDAMDDDRQPSSEIPTSVIAHTVAIDARATETTTTIARRAFVRPSIDVVLRARRRVDISSNLDRVQSNRPFVFPSPSIPPLTTDHDSYSRITTHHEIRTPTRPRPIARDRLARASHDARARVSLERSTEPSIARLSRVMRRERARA